MANRKIRELKAHTNKYKYTNDANFGVSADVAGAELEKLSQQHGHLSSSIVVDAARPEDAPLHPAFEWDDAIAGERYRRQQASTLVRAVVVVPVPNSTTPEHRAYVRVATPEQPKPVYLPALAVAASPSMYADALSRLERRLNEATTSVRELSGLAQSAGEEPERMARIALAVRALEAAGAAIAGLH